MNAVLLSLFVLMPTNPAAAASPAQAAPSEAAPAALQLEDLGWLAGTWKSPAAENGPRSEETWSEPAAGAMMGAFRAYSDQRVIIYEFLLLEQTPNGIVMQLRHFRPGLASVEDEPIRLALQDSTPSQLVFVNQSSDTPRRIVYAREGSERLAVTIESTRDGQPETFTLNFERAPNGRHSRANWSTR